MGLLLACLRSGTIVLNNWSLVLIDLTLNKVIKSTVPVFVVFFSIVVEKKKYSWQIIVTLMFIILGTILSCLHTASVLCVCLRYVWGVPCVFRTLWGSFNIC